MNTNIKIQALNVIKDFKKSGKKHLLITGEKKSGKTTLLNEILKQKSKVGGIVTDVIRDEKTPPKYVTLRDYNIPNENQIIATRDISGTFLVPITETFETFGANILIKYIKSNINHIIIDEIGFLENNATNYQKAIIEAMNKKEVIFVLRKQSTQFIEQIKARGDVHLVDLGQTFY